MPSEKHHPIRVSFDSEDFRKLKQACATAHATMEAFIEGAALGVAETLTRIRRHRKGGYAPENLDVLLRAVLAQRPQLPELTFEKLAKEYLQVPHDSQSVQDAWWALFASGRPYISLAYVQTHGHNLRGSAWKFDNQLLDAPYRIPLDDVAEAVLKALFDAAQGKQNRRADEWTSGLNLHGYNPASVMHHLSRTHPDKVRASGWHPGKRMFGPDIRPGNYYKVFYPGWETWKVPLVPKKPAKSISDPSIPPDVPLEFPKSLRVKVSEKVDKDEQLLEPVVLPEVLKHTSIPRLRTE